MGSSGLNQNNTLGSPAQQVMGEERLSKSVPAAPNRGNETAFSSGPGNTVEKNLSEKDTSGNQMINTMAN